MSSPQKEMSKHHKELCTVCAMLLTCLRSLCRSTAQELGSQAGPQRTAASPAGTAQGGHTDRHRGRSARKRSQQY